MNAFDRWLARSYLRSEPFRLPFNGTLSADEIRLIQQGGAEGLPNLEYSTVATQPRTIGPAPAALQIEGRPRGTPPEPGKGSPPRARQQAPTARGGGDPEPASFTPRRPAP